MESYVGIDPGKKGAWCVLVPEIAVAHFIDGKCRPLEIYAWFLDMNRQYDLQGICTEDVHSIYGMSAKSNFSFGRNVQTPFTLLDIAGLEPTLVQPKKWQKAVGVTSKGKDIKKNVAQICTSLYPQAQIYGPKGGLMDGRSDACMIAYYSYLLHTGKI